MRIHRATSASGRLSTDAALARAALLAVDADGAATPEMRGIAALRAEVAFARGATDLACQNAGLALARARSLEQNLGAGHPLAATARNLSAAPTVVPAAP